MLDVIGGHQVVASLCEGKTNPTPSILTYDLYILTYDCMCIYSDIQTFTAHERDVNINILCMWSGVEEPKVEGQHGNHSGMRVML